MTNYYVQQLEIQYSLDEILEKKHAIEDDDVLITEIQDEFSLEELFSPTYQRNIFYIFTYDANGQEISFSASRGNTYREDVIRRKAQAIMNMPEENGQNGMYFFQKENHTDGTTELAMLDCSYMIYSSERLLYASAAVGIIGVLTSLILVIIFSKKAIEPEIRNNEKQMQFLTNVSHELKTPLAVIQSNAEMEEIVRGESEFTQSTIRQVNRMNGLIKSLVMITKTKEKSDSNLIADINISDIASETLQEFSAMASGEDKTIVNNIEKDLIVHAYESTIRQLIMLLIDNAIKYCDDNGTITITIERMKKGKKIVRLTVSNDYAEGETIDYTRFFDRFYREDESHNIDKSGYGIGLSIAKNICEQNNGDIYVTWKDGVINFICELV
ncbi:MAG: HAMP domain-containing histidine kinase [Lachnospiraceae bacterium]|nr:HAMP domain-containing histidine kinase [Lachnospiraceae bacterium]